MEEYRRTNREKKLQPVTKPRMWCDHCDAQLVHEWEKCPNCGKRSGRRRLKKETNA